MGGRGSMMKCALRIGGGESRMRRRAGLGLGSFRVRQLFSLVRQVDDGALAAPNHCLGCALRFLRHCWGRSLRTSLEEEGPVIKFCDMLESFSNGRFSITMYRTNSPELPRHNPPMIRLLPHAECLHPVRYVRCLLWGHMHCACQVLGHANQVGLLYCTFELIRELHATPLVYPCKILKKATFGFRPPWARAILQSVRALLVSLEEINTSGAI